MLNASVLCAPAFRAVKEITYVLAVPDPQLLEGVTVNVPLVVGFKEILFPDPVIVPVPE
jgi:hypothetical protein